MTPRPERANAGPPSRPAGMQVAPRGGMPTRTAALWVPDWPVLAAMAAREVDAHVPAATHDGHRILAVSAVARAQGVRRGMRRRAAREVCPELVFCDADDAVAARDFEPVALAVESVVAGLEILRPGLVLLPATGAARYHGSEDRLAAELIAAVAARTGHECQVGIGDGILAAVLAARESRIVTDADSFLAGRPTGDLVHVVDASDSAALADLLHLLARLGIHTLGALATLPADRVAERFGALGAWAHRLARGDDVRPPARRRIEPDAAVSTALDPPVTRAEAVAFVAHRLAEDLCDLLAARSVVAGRLRITARTEDGGELERTWRAGAEGQTVARITDRVRWQVDGWLTTAALGAGAVATAGQPALAPLVHLAVAAEEVVPAGAQQPRLWGAASGTDARAHRALGRVQGLLSGSVVLVPRVQGGRDARDTVQLVPFGEEIAVQRDPALPWPGQLPAPRPGLVPADSGCVAVLDAGGRPVVVDERGAMSGAPTAVCCGHENCQGSRPTTHAFHARNGSAPQRPAPHGLPRNGPQPVRDWAGPWPLTERWWGPDPRHRAYLQVLLDDGTALLLATDRGAWTVEGIYD